MADKRNMSSDTQPRPHSRQLGLTTSQAARELGVSLSTVRRWSDLGYLPGYRTPGGQRRFSREQIDGFLASLERNHRSPEDR
jgi:excisionase family DNA binding protein